MEVRGVVDIVVEGYSDIVSGIGRALPTSFRHRTP